MTRILGLVVAVGLCAGVASSAERKAKNVGVEAFDDARANTNAIVLDVRTPKEYNSGHIPGAVLLDISAPDFERKLTKLDKSKTYLVHCGTGRRSARACGRMESLGFSNIIHMPDGFSGWVKAGKPVEKTAPAR